MDDRNRVLALLVSILATSVHSTSTECQDTVTNCHEYLSRCHETHVRNFCQKACNVCVQEECPPGSVHLGDDCFMFMTEVASNKKAMKHCHAMNAVLSIEGNHDAVQQYLDENFPKRSFLVGASYNCTGGKWRWNMGGYVPDILQWAPGEPSDVGSNNCLLWNGDLSGLQSAPCDLNYNYICSIRKNTLKPTIMGCTEPWFIAGAGCLSFHLEERKDREAAQIYCEDNGGYLAQPYSFKELHYAMDAYYKEFTGELWIGGDHQKEEGRAFFNSDWKISEMVDSEKQNCMQLVKNEHFNFNGSNCKSLKGFICEKEVDSKTEATPTFVFEYHGPIEKVWNASECREIEGILVSDLDQCLLKCDNIPSCTDVVFGGHNGECYMVQCPDSTPEPSMKLLPPYGGYHKVPNSCESPWIVKGSQCLYISECDKKTWKGAIEKCKIVGGNIYEPKNMTMISNAFNKDDDLQGEFWIGGSNIDEEGKWLFNSGHEIPILFFGNKYPESNKTKNCVKLTKNKDTKLDIGICTQKKSYICRKSFLSETTLGPMTHFSNTNHKVTPMQPSFSYGLSQKSGPMSSLALGPEASITSEKEPTPFTSPRVPTTSGSTTVNPPTSSEKSSTSEASKGTIVMLGKIISLATSLWETSATGSGELLVTDPWKALGSVEQTSVNPKPSTAADPETLSITDPGAKLVLGLGVSTTLDSEESLEIRTSTTPDASISATPATTAASMWILVPKNDLPNIPMIDASTTTMPVTDPFFSKEIQTDRLTTTASDALWTTPVTEPESMESGDTPTNKQVEIPAVGPEEGSVSDPGFLPTLVSRATTAASMWILVPKNDVANIPWAQDHQDHEPDQKIVIHS